MIRKTLFWLANAVVLSLIGVHWYDAYNVNRFAGVGGQEAYRAARLAQLEHARARLSHLTPEIRAIEELAIDEQILELEAALPVAEIGAETRRVK
jgi:hypothetical protein